MIGMEQVAIRLVVAAVCGGLIGLERETHAQAAGLRTHMVLAVGSALIMIVSIEVGRDGGDPGRIAAQVVSGIGFLGAGAIIRYGTTIRGLTTAACVWTAAGIGLAVGAGMVVQGSIATGIVFLVVWGVDHVERALGIGRDLRRFRLVARDGEAIMGRLKEVFGRHRGIVRKLQMAREGEGGKAHYNLEVLCMDDQDLEPLVRELSALDSVERVELE